MATTSAPKTAAKPDAVKKPPVSMNDRIKNQLTQGVLRNKVTVDELSDLEQHIKKLSSILA